MSGGFQNQPGATRIGGTGDEFDVMGGGLQNQPSATPIGGTGIGTDYDIGTGTNTGKYRIFYNK